MKMVVGKRGCENGKRVLYSPKEVLRKSEYVTRLEVAIVTRYSMRKAQSIHLQYSKWQNKREAAFQRSKS
jgi:hypothetical protein